MAVNRIDELSQFLGSIDANIKYIKERVNAIEVKQDSQTTQFLQHQNRLDNIDIKISGIEPVIVEYTSLKQQSIGAGKLGKAMWAGIGAVGTAILAIAGFVWR